MKHLTPEQRYTIFVMKQGGYLQKDIAKAIGVCKSTISRELRRNCDIRNSGCAGKTKRGLEILDVGLIDIDNKNCISLQANQTPDSLTLENENATLIDWYTLVIKSMKDKILPVTNYIVADSYFSKYNFAKSIQELGFQLISRFRDDAVMFYPTQEEPTCKRGRPKKYDGKIDFKNPNLSRMERVNIHIDDGQLYSLVAYSKSLKQLVKLVVCYSKDKKRRKLYFSTDATMSAIDVVEYYRTRFQIEFCFRDAKQFTGLNHCQARDVNKLSFHFNASLTCVNIAKVLAKERDIPFSMATYKALIHNAYLLERFICVSGIKPNKRLNDKLVKELIEFTAIAA